MAYPKTQTYTLPEGIELSFTDGGPPPNSSDYTTVFAIHGVTFNAYQFRKLHQHSHAFNLRTVALHRRDYIGSTSLTTSELEEMNRGDRSYWDRLSAQVAQLLKLFIERENIPKLTVTGNRRSGGIAIMGWSFGCATVLSLLGSARNPRIPRELYKLLEKYIGDFVLYDPPAVAFGYPLPADCKNYNPWLDSSLSPAEVPMAFARWVSSYYDHPCYDSATRSLPASATIHDLDGARRYANKEEEVSIASWTETELTKGIELEPGANDVIL
ncbi:hypothetical protein GYMLUDRAFT_153315 [Collybiopsis luxurians FD-317 M1]|nr:hypothetical protein GYMLUDRAFT_153315 [Collybiopsis luxurians FD-317 M1]